MAQIVGASFTCTCWMHLHLLDDNPAASRKSNWSDFAPPQRIVSRCERKIGAHL
jgi:hypothetical protein